MKSKIIIIAITIIIFASCKKNGTGGKATIEGNVKHHTLAIPNARVYIKFGATEFPGKDLSQYDMSALADANAHYKFDDMRQGDYYLYAVGYDNTISEDVFGGIGVSISYNDRKHTINADVPVVE